MEDIQNGGHKKSEVDTLVKQNSHDSTTENETSTSSSNSSVDTMEGLGDFDIKGQIRLTIWYEDGPKLLLVRVDEAKSLVGVKPEGYSDPYVKLHLIPLHKEPTDDTKRKTSVKRNTNDPKYVEYFEYPLPKEELSEKLLWLTVWDFVEQGIHVFLGEVSLQLSKLKFTGRSQDWYQLRKWYSPVVGELNLGLLLEMPALVSEHDMNKLHVIIKRAQYAHDSEYTQCFVKAILLPDMSEKTTKIVKGSPNPVWNEDLVYQNMSQEKLTSAHVLELQLVGLTNSNLEEFIGGLRIGPSQDVNSPKEWMDSSVEETDHWEDMLSNPGVLMESCHTLRPTMKFGAHTDGIELSGYRDNIIIDQCAIKLSRLRLTASSRKSSHSGCTSSSSDFCDFIPQAPSLSGLIQQQTKDKKDVGCLQVGLMIEQCHKSRYDNHVNLFVIIGTGEGIECTNYSHCFASIVLLPGIANKMTKMIEAAPVMEWDELFTFDDVSLDQLSSNRTIEIKLFGKTILSNIQQIGGLRLGPPQNSGFTPVWVDSNEKEAEHWKEMLSNPTNWANNTHVLRSSMEYEELADVPSLVPDMSSEELGVKNTSVNKTSSLVFLNLGLKYEYNPIEGGCQLSVLHVRIDGAIILKRSTKGEYFVNIRLLPIKGALKQTQRVKYVNVAEWNEEFEFFEINKEHLSFKYLLEVTLWKIKLLKKPKFLGALHVGPGPRPGCTAKYIDSTEDEVEHWEKMLANPNTWVKTCHMLRDTIEFRKMSDILLEDAVKKRDIMMNEAKA